MRQKTALNVVATEASCCFISINGLFDETQLFDTNKLQLIWLNIRNSAISISKQLPTLFQVSHYTNKFLNLNKGSTNATLKRCILISCLKSLSGYFN